MDRGTGNEEGYGPPAVGNGFEGEGYGHEGISASMPAGRAPPGMGTRPPPDLQPAPALLAGHESASGTRSTEGPVRRPVQTSVGTLASRSTAVHGEDPVKLAGAPSVRLPDQRVMKPSRAVETDPAAPEGWERRPAGYGAQQAAGTPLGSMEFFFSYLWDKSSFPVQQAQDEPRSLQDGGRGIVTGTPRGGALTQRGPPLQIPSPFSGFGLMMGGAFFGASSSGVGGAPLLAVIFCCLFAVLWRGWSRAYGALLRPGTAPRLALPRPG